MTQAEVLGAFGMGEVLDAFEVARRIGATSATARLLLRKLRRSGEIEIVGEDSSRNGPGTIGGASRNLYRAAYYGFEIPPAK